MSYTPDVQDIKYSMDNHTTVEPGVDPEILREAGCLDRVCVLPKDFNDRVQYLGNMLVQMLTKTPKEDELRATTGSIAQTLSYLLNSSSWQDGTLHWFDRDEVCRKLSRFNKGQQ
jgi:hypothetical protein